MAGKNGFHDFSVSKDSAARFQKACLDPGVSPAPGTPDGKPAGGFAGGIGVQNEKRLHAVIKRFISPDTARHEIKLAEAGPETGGVSGGYVADILSEEGEIYEIQTGSLFPLRDKIKWYLEHTDFSVKVVFPVAKETSIVWVDSESGALSPPRRSPKRGKLTEVARELFWVREFIGDERFSLTVLFIKIEEYRERKDKTSPRGQNYRRLERIPLELEGMALLNKKTDYAVFLPENFTGEFTAACFSKATGIKGKSVYSVLKILCGLGLVAVTGEKKKRCVLYKTLCQ